MDNNDHILILPYRRVIFDGDDIVIIYVTRTFRGVYFTEEIKLGLKQEYKILKIDRI